MFKKAVIFTFILLVLVGSLHAHAAFVKDNYLAFDAKKQQFLNNPWLTGIKAIGLALFAFWFYFRVTKQEIFVMLAGAIFLVALTLLIFLHGKEASVSLWGILANLVTMFIAFTVLNAIFASKLYFHVPQFGIIEEEKLVDPDKGIQLPFVIISAFILIILLRISLGNIFQIFEHKRFGLGLGGSAWVIYAMLSAAAGYLTTFIMPFDVSRDTFVTVQDNTKAVDVFEVRENLSNIEKAAVPFALFLFFFAIPFFFNPNRSDGDTMGILVLFGVLVSVIKVQFFSGTKLEPLKKK